MSSSDINNDPYVQHHQLYQQHQQHQHVDNNNNNNNHNHSHNNNSNNNNSHGHSHSHHRNQIGHAQPYYSTYNQLNNSGGIPNLTISLPYNNQYNNQYNNNNNSQYNNNQYNNINQNNNNGYFSMDKNSYSGITISHLLNNLNRDNDAKKLGGWICVMLLFTVYEIFYGAYLESLGLVSDGFHALFDCIGLFIALLGMLVGKKGSDSEYTYGYDRWEVLGTFSNGAFLIFVSFFLFLESVERLLEPPHIHNHGRVISLATISLLINIIGFVFFKQKTNERKSSSIRNENLVTISQHILIDSCTSLGVIVSSIVGSIFGLEISDSLISIIIACIIVYNAVPICIKTSGILLQKTPDSLIFNIGNALKDVAVMNGVIEIKEKHFWSHSIGNNVGTLLISVKKNCDESYLLDSIRNRLSFIQDLTIQLDSGMNEKHQHHHNDEQKSNKHSHSHSHDHHDHHHEDHHDHHHHHHQTTTNNDPIPLYQVQQTPISSPPPTNNDQSYQAQSNNYRYNNDNNTPTSPIPLYSQSEPDPISDEEDNDPYHHHHQSHSHNRNQHHGHSHDNDNQHHGHSHNHDNDDHHHGHAHNH